MRVGWRKGTDGGQSTGFRAANCKLVKKDFNAAFEINRAKAYLSYFEKWHPGFKYLCLRSIILITPLFRLAKALLQRGRDRINTFVEILRFSFYPEPFLRSTNRYPARTGKK